MYIRSRRDSFLPALVGLALAAPMASYADLKITADVQIQRPADPNSPATNANSPDPAVQTVTTYYQGDKVRIETTDGVTLYDRASDRVYRLNATDKTYTTAKTQDFLARSDASVLASALAYAPPGAKPDAKVDLTKDTVISPQAFAGRQATHYTLTGTLNFRSEESGGSGGYGGRGGGGGVFGGGRHGGGRRGGGGFPGGGFPGGGSSGRGEGSGRRGGATRALPSAHITGEVWLADVTLPKTKAKHPLLPLLAEDVPSAPLATALADKIAKQKLFPVSSRVTITWQGGNPYGVSGGRANNAQSGGSITISSETHAIADETLSSSLFTVPGDYRLTDTR